MSWQTPTTRATGDIITASIYNGDLVNNLLFLYSVRAQELACTEITASVPTTATTEAGATTVIGPTTAFTADGTSEVIVEFWCPTFSTNQTAEVGYVAIVDDAGNVLGRIEVQEISTTGGYPLTLRRRYIPASGSRTYTAKAYTTAGTFTIKAGAGGATTMLPAFLRVSRAGL